MIRPTRRLAAVLSAAALAAGTLTATAGPAQAAAPPAPTQVMGYGGHASYILEWKTVVDVPAYDVRLYPSTNTAVAPLQSTTVWSTGGEYLDHAFTGLAPGKSYYGTVAAINDDNEKSAYVGAPGTTPAYAVPGAVRSFKVVAGNGRATLRWKAPVTTPLTGPMSGYIVTATGMMHTIDLGPKATSTVIKGLTNGETYTFNIWPFAGAEFDPGTMSSRKATPVGKPAKPSALKVAFTSAGKAKVSWKVAKSTKKAPVTGYTVYVNGKKTKSVTGKKATKLTVKGIKRGKKYTFSVRAYNGVTTSKAITSKKLRRP